jgi:hypothetical protein
MNPDELFSILRPQLDKNELAKLPGRPLYQHELVLEFAFWIAVVLLTIALVKAWPSLFLRLERFGNALSKKRGLAVGIVILAALSIRALLLIALPYPEPVVHDEYSYLLQAATFASGKITNPTPVGWEHFETFHVNMRPTYQSMYPPGQALFLAAAEVVHAHPWWGVWLSVGLMCGAVCWMLQGWMPPQWAFLGGLFCVVRFATFSYWVNTYWGGAVAAIGGALLLGSLPRLKRRASARYALLFALGLAILANTRPYEGFIFSVPAMLALMLWLVPGWRRGQVRLVALAPAAVLLVAVGLAMGYYNWESTGHPTMMPYMANHQQYHITKPFIWQARLPVANYRHQVMRTFYTFHELPDYLNRSTPGGLTKLFRQRVSVYYEFFIWPMMIPVIFAVWQMMKSRKMRIFPITLLLMFGGLLIEQWPPHDHYAAPVLGVALVVVLYGLRLMWTWQPRGWLLGPTLVRSSVLVVFVLSLLALGQRMVNPYQLFPDIPVVSPVIERARLITLLQRTPGEHLVFVHLHQAERGSIFWIYNEPDLAHSRIIWAHDMGDAENRELMKLYPNRHAWLIDKDDSIDALTPYPGLGEHVSSAPRLVSGNSQEVYGH